MSSVSNVKRNRFVWIFYALTALGLIALLVWATLGEIARNPSREAVADLGSYGPITVRLQTNPYPARPTGTVKLTFMLIDSRRNIIQPDSLSFEYGREGDSQPFGSGSAQLMSDGSGALMGGAQFPSVGMWWLRVNLAKDGYQDNVQFVIDVRPAQ